MKLKLQLLTIGILFPVLMNAQFYTLRGVKSSIPKRVTHSVSKNSPPTLFSSPISGFYREGFDGITFPPVGWQVIDELNPNINWEQTYAFPFSGSNSVYIGYGNNTAQDWLILPQFTVAATDSFSFWLAAEFTGYPPDSTFVLVSTTDSALTSFTTVVATLAEGLNYPTTPFVYQKYSFPLAPFAGSDIYVAIKNKNTFGDGLLIDRVDIGTKPSLNATPMSIDISKYIPTSMAFTPSATFQNDGNTVQSFPAIMTTTGGYTSTKNITNLAPGASQQVLFDPWTPPATPGNEIVTVQTQLAGDGYAADDSLSMSIKLLEPFTNYGWSSRAPIPYAAQGIAITAINSNDTSYVFAMGGDTLVDGGSAAEEANLYLPNSNSWNSIANMVTGAAYACAASYNNKLYVLGGNDAFGLTADNRIYDSATDTWSLGAPLLTATQQAATGVYRDSLIYVIGGLSNGNLLNSVQIYDPAIDVWFPGTNMPVLSFNNVHSGGISGNKIVVTDGTSTLLGVIDPTDATTITWTVVDDYPAGTASNLSGGGSIDPASGLVIFTGGGPQFAASAGSDATFAYDVNTNQWKVGPSKITSAFVASGIAAVVDNDSLYMVSVGGYGAGSLLDVNEWLNLGPFVITTSVSENDPLNFNITCSPNPFINDVKINFSLSQVSAVKVVIVDPLGREVETLCDKNLQTGEQQFKWNASKYSEGIYFCKLLINGKPFAQKLLKY